MPYIGILAPGRNENHQLTLKTAPASRFECGSLVL